MPRPFTPGVVVLLALGAVAYLLAMVGSAVAGGLDVLEACNHAVTGVWGEDYRESDLLQVEHHYLVPHATCRWSDGRTAPLMHVAPLPLVGPILIGACSITIVGRLLRRRHHRRRGRRERRCSDSRSGGRQPWA